MLRRLASLKEGEWSCYRGGQFNRRENYRYRGGHFNDRENGYVTEVVSFNGGRKVMLQKWSL